MWGLYTVTTVEVNNSLEVLLILPELIRPRAVRTPSAKTHETTMISRPVVYAVGSKTLMGVIPVAFAVV